MHWLLWLHIENSAVYVPLYVLAAALGAYLLWRTAPRRRGAVRPGKPGRPWLAAMGWTAGAALLGAATGLVACWLVGDVWNVFGIQLTAVTRAWVAVAFAGTAAALANIVGSRWWRVVIACAAVPVFALTAAVGINIDFGAYPTAADALGISRYQTLAVPASFHAPGSANDAGLAADATAAPTDLLQSWRPDEPLPARGRVGQVDIPGTRSHFHGRPAVVYLPPAALVSNAPALPVIYAFAGQPGNPANMFSSGRIEDVLNAYAARHHGLAPIVVAPDQLGSPSRNPMCADSRLGNAATYLLTDVPRWIHTHLKAAAPGRAWGIVGFSEGGTCAIQFAAGEPDMFRTILDISGEVVPTVGRNTVEIAFGGSQTAYDAIKPLRIMKQHAPYTDTVAMFAVGQNDAKYTARMHTVDAAARAAGMHTSELVSPGTAHDWNTVRYAIRQEVPKMATRLLSAR